MEKHFYEEELSKKTLEGIKNHIKAEDCYNNVATAIEANLDKFITNEWKVAYGYWHIKDDFWTKHCFILTEQNEVIDPTAALYSEQTYNLYISFAILEYSEYQQLLKDNRMCPDLHFSLMKKNFESRDVLRKEYGIVCVD